MTTAPVCHACGSADLVVAPAYRHFHRVTSDCTPWPAGGSLARCRECGLVQTLVTPRWRVEAEAIYRGYAIYHQGGGSEQRVFDVRTGAGAPRSERIIQALQRSPSRALPAQGRLLDVGCGNGAFLAAWSRLTPGWTLCGSEVNEKYRAQVEAIPGVERLYTCGLNEIPGQFDLISLIHVFEHIPGPGQFLAQLRDKLRPGGLLLIEVPDCEQNVFMLLVADHCSHFSPSLLAGIVEAAGYEVVDAGNGWVLKEVSLVARKPAEAVPPGASEGNRLAGEKRAERHAAAERVLAGCERLEGIAAHVQRLAEAPTFGLFGTAIAATWLDAQTGQAARFFVDEDTNRIGRTHLGRPILAPSAVPPGATVFVALPQPLADAVATRLRQGNPTVHIALP